MKENKDNDKKRAWIPRQGKKEKRKKKKGRKMKENALYIWKKKF